MSTTADNAAIREAVINSLSRSEQAIIHYMHKIFRSSPDKMTTGVTSYDVRPYDVKRHHLDGAWDKLKKKGFLMPVVSTVKDQRLATDEKGNYIYDENGKAVREEYDRIVTRYTLNPLLRESVEDQIRDATKLVESAQKELDSIVKKYKENYSTFIRLTRTLMPKLTELPLEAPSIGNIKRTAVSDTLNTVASAARECEWNADSYAQVKRRLSNAKKSLKALREQAGLDTEVVTG
jgi:hypothetical protein